MKGEESTTTTTSSGEQMDTSSSMTEMANDEDDRKLFVGGLPQDAKDSDIKEHFQTFGEIESINIKTDPQTGRSRGFAFVVFKALEVWRRPSPQSTASSQESGREEGQAKQGKIYVGKLKAEISDEDIKAHFSQYGPVANVEQPFDKTKNERKNFCFITFEKEEPAKRLLKEGTVTLKGSELEIKKVTPKPDIRGMGGPMGGGRGGRGGGNGVPGVVDAAPGAATETTGDLATVQAMELTLTIVDGVASGGAATTTPAHLGLQEVRPLGEAPEGDRPEAAVAWEPEDKGKSPTKGTN
ncbi:RNA-binding protein squid [Caligus rogercresseyi]|uniref:RNA-binding protein squid n=1 Tax=Caligus rogercresseyi TaxID=217165 RepID=A0A7T8KL70_CALRO|nr:RNA-binding protein squid [Caligus rogercresseyi]